MELEATSIETPYSQVYYFYSVRNSFKYVLLLVAFLSSGVNAQVRNQNDQADPLQPAEKWFAAWELVSQEIFGLRQTQPVEFVFFDEEFVYSTSTITIPDGQTMRGPALQAKQLTWKKAVHGGKIILPDEQTVPVGIMSFAAPLENSRAPSFFVMPLPSFWKSKGVDSKELGLDNMLTGVFLHEFSHSQQMQNFGKKISAYEERYTFDTDFSDDIIQHYFEKDSVYTSLFRKEVALFYEATAAKDQRKFQSMLKKALDMYAARQQKYFVEDKTHFSEIDDFFLTMEGIGQYTMYAWLIHPEGGNLSKETVLKGVRRGGRFWSQEEGLALFLVLERLDTPAVWAPDLFGSETKTIPNKITDAMKKKWK